MFQPTSRIPNEPHVGEVDFELGSLVIYQLYISMNYSY